MIKKPQNTVHSRFKERECLDGAVTYSEVIEFVSEGIAGLKISRNCPHRERLKKTEPINENEIDDGVQGRRRDGINGNFGSASDTSLEEERDGEWN